MGDRTVARTTRAVVERSVVSGVRHRPIEDIGRIEVAPGVCGGAPCIAGTRIPVQTIYRCWRGRWAIGKILAEYPSLREADVIAALAYHAGVCRGIALEKSRATTEAARHRLTAERKAAAG